MESAAVDPAIVHAAEIQMCRPAPKRLRPGESDGDELVEGKRPRIAGGDTHRATAWNYVGMSAGPFKGYLVMCGFKRQNSALKEAVQMLTPYLEEVEADAVWWLRPSKSGGCRLKLASLRVACEGVLLLRAFVDAEAAVEVSPSQTSSSLPLQHQNALDNFDPARPLARLIADVYADRRPTSKWCQRVIPIMRTCPMRLNDIETTARALLAASTLPTPAPGSTALRFAVSCKQRSTAGMDVIPRGELIAVLATAMSEEAARQLQDKQEGTTQASPSTPAAVVDLSRPQVLLMVQQLPIRSTAGITGDETSDVCALSIITSDLLVFKPSQSAQVKGLADESVRPSKKTSA